MSEIIHGTVLSPGVLFNQLLCIYKYLMVLLTYDNNNYYITKYNYQQLFELKLFEIKLYVYYNITNNIYCYFKIIKNKMHIFILLLM